MIKRLLALYAFAYPYEGLWVDLFDSYTMLKPYRIVGLTVLALFVLKQFGRSSRLRLDGYDAAFAAIIGGGFVLALIWYLLTGNASLRYASEETVLLTFSFAIYIVIKNEVVTLADAETLLVAYVAGTVSSVLITQGITPEISGERLRAYFLNPNGLAIASALGLHCVIARGIVGKFRHVVFGYVTLATLGVFLAYVLFITGSRTPIIAFGVSSFVFVIPLWRRSSGARMRSLALLPALMAAAFVIVSVLSKSDDDTVVRRYTLEAVQRGSGRFDIWRSAWRLAEDHYFLGVGTGQYRYYHRTYIEMLTKLYSRNVNDTSLGAHSDYMNLITCYGLPLFLVYLGTLVSIIRRVIRAVKTAPDTSFAAAALLAIIICIAINQSAHNMMMAPAYFLMMALATGSYLTQHEPAARGFTASRIARPPFLADRLGS